jgi:hypothetical protein
VPRKRNIFAVGDWTAPKTLKRYRKLLFWRNGGLEAARGLAGDAARETLLLLEEGHAFRLRSVSYGGQTDSTLPCGLTIFKERVARKCCLDASV